MKALLALLLMTGAALAQANPPPKVVLAWNASASTNVITNYAVYFGSSSGNYTNSVNAGTALTVTVTNVTRGQTYFFAATCKDNQGLESAFSNEVSTSLPLPPSPPGTLRIVP